MSNEDNEEMRRGPGRPPTELGTAAKRSVRVHDELWKQTQANAAELGITTGEYTRRALIYVNAGRTWEALK